jgi:tetratricopeptide (TPR) repeat protein
MLADSRPKLRPAGNVPDQEPLYLRLNRSGRRLRAVYVGLALLLIAAGVGGTGALTIYHCQQQHRWNSWAPQVGRVTRTGDLGPDCFEATISYRYAGKRYDGRACGSGAGPAVGARVEVRVNPEDPNQHLSELSCNDTGPAIWLVVLGSCAVLLLCGVLVLVDLRRMGRLLSCGEATLFDPALPEQLYLLDESGRRRRRALRFFPSSDALAWSFSGETRPGILLTDSAKRRRCYLVRQTLLEPTSRSDDGAIPRLPLEKSLRPGFSAAAVGIVIGIASFSSAVATASSGSATSALATLGFLGAIGLVLWGRRAIALYRGVALSAAAADEVSAGRLDQADAFYRRAASALPRHSSEHQSVVFSLAAVCLKRGDPQRALELFYSAEQHGRSDPDGSLAGHVGMTYALLGKVTPARLWLRRARQRTKVTRALDKSVWVGEALVDCRTGRFEDCIERLQPHAAGADETADLACLLLAFAENCAMHSAYRGDASDPILQYAGGRTGAGHQDSAGAAMRTIAPAVARRFHYLGAAWPALASFLAAAGSAASASE